jgi:hypothetical protein
MEELDSRFDRSYWLQEPADIIARNLPRYAEAKQTRDSLSIHTEYYPARGATLISVIADDHPGLFSASPGPSAWPGPTSSTHASTPPASARRSTISWCRTRWASRSARKTSSPA